LKLKAFIAMIFLSFISSSTVLAASEPGATTYRKFVVYYGWYSDHDGKLSHDIDMIINGKPEFVISPYHTSTGQINLEPEVIDKFHNSGIKVMIYVATGNGGRDLGDVLDEIKTGLGGGADGVMLDEVALLQTQPQVDYYKNIYDYTKSFGSDKIVIANPGSILVSEKVMAVSDIVSFEHQWRLAPHIDWFSKYPATRFMGISSNDITNVMGYKVEGEAAIQDTVEAWQSGIAYHFSTDVYTHLPSWFEDYQGGLDDYGVSGAKLHELAVKTFDSQGHEINGLWVEVKKNDRVVITGFSPTKFMLPEGNYQVGASDYQDFVFDKWLDGETMHYHSVAMAGAAELTAVYKSELADFRIESFDNLGNSVKGMHVSVSRAGSVVAEGFTPLYLRLPLGQYTVDASSYDYYQFTRWDDGSSSSTKLVDFTQSTKMTAYYTNTLADQIGGDIFACSDMQYRQQVAGSLLEGGPLAGMLNLQMQKSVMASEGCISP
jgi:hypothetical protein